LKVRFLHGSPFIINNLQRTLKGHKYGLFIWGNTGVTAEALSLPTYSRCLPTPTFFQVVHIKAFCPPCYHHITPKIQGRLPESPFRCCRTTAACSTQCLRHWQFIAERVNRGDIKLVSSCRGVPLPSLFLYLSFKRLSGIFSKSFSKNQAMAIGYQFEFVFI
jgi:hypothetical protein